MAGDDSSYNRWDDNGADRKATDFAQIDINGVGWYMFNIDTSIVNRWYDGETWPVVLISDVANGVNCTFRASEHSTTSQRPIIWLTYDLAPQVGSGRRRFITNSCANDK
jgi:hypothetical protein